MPCFDGERPEALFYLDIALDLKQLWLFWQEKLFGYFTVNLAGMTLPPTFTMLEAVRFSARPSPECDQLKKLLTPKMVVPVMLLSILTQTHMVLLVAASALSRRTHGRRELLGTCGSFRYLQL